ncbi:hypothetical protein VTK73DRAFT_4111 [Phialemonium thermophilum]|uniref:Uncharacterized protein n=1 Tax=Phialemonium thermophilum TaxID=223376 RepID=A0ABR3VCQ6_9PEZI
MNGRNVRLSPVSLGGKDWSYSSPIDNDGPYPGGGNRGQLISPPNSGGSSSGTMNGFPPGPRSVGGPSPPPSIGRSSAGTNLYARSESGRSQRDENAEAVLGEHYVSLRRFLSAMSRDGKPNTPPNKARDKLQRLTGVQPPSGDPRTTRSPTGAPRPTCCPRTASTRSATRPARSSPRWARPDSATSPPTSSASWSAGILTSPAATCRA